MNRIKITDTSLRDGHQSLWATRMSLEDMQPILKRSMMWDIIPWKSGVELLLT